MALTTAVARRNTTLDNLLDSLNGGTINIYDGSRPAGPDTAVGAQVLLAVLTFNATAFGAASSGSKTANAITADSSANATGTASWFRCLTSGAAAVIDGSVGTSGADLNLNTTSIVSGAEVSISSFVVSQS